VRTAAEFRVLFTRKGAPMLLGIAVFTLLALGALFYWLDPNIRTFADGLWLAFITGATVGYGDVVPTTPATRVLAVLTVLVGVAMMTLFTAHVVTFFVGGEDAKMRDALQHEIRELRREIRELREELEGMRDKR
jgi:voltage-gated potassium channel